jgi:hypothetical protein
MVGGLGMGKRMGLRLVSDGWLEVMVDVVGMVCDRGLGSEGGECRAVKMMADGFPFLGWHFGDIRSIYLA